MKKVIVASKNPVKIDAVSEAFSRMFTNEEFEFEGVSVPSGVADQPMGDEETYIGASNRAKAASEQFDGEFFVGLEGGLNLYEEGSTHEGEMRSFAWMVVRDATGKVGKARTSCFLLPPEVAALIGQGKELGEADDIVFGQTNSKQAGGAVGLLTSGVITRTDYYAEAMVMALIPFKHDSLYPSAAS